MLEQLKPGMTKQQVLYVLGTPLIQDMLHTDRWDYVYSLSRQGQTPDRYYLTVFFQGNQFIRMESDLPEKLGMDLPTES